MTRDEAVRAYSAPGRHYHNLKHIEDCLAALGGVAGLSAYDREVLTAAIWWHDIVCDPTRSDNEEESAKLAERDLAPELRHEVGRLIRLTRTHDVQPGDRLGAIMISIDLGILGSEPSAYTAYAAAIRREYGHVPDDAYRAGRLAVLERFAARPAIYPDATFAARLEKQARANIAREIETLRTSAPKPQKG
ncbi:MAG TPA: phosphohydrolase [Bradyrhizobium sp.]|nr:phosphohydrolase [Bradyrhizobium sp.]